MAMCRMFVCYALFLIVKLVSTFGKWNSLVYFYCDFRMLTVSFLESILETCSVVLTFESVDKVL